MLAIVHLLISLLVSLRSVYSDQPNNFPKCQKLIDSLCENGDLYSAHKQFRAAFSSDADHIKVSSSESAAALHALSALELILFADAIQAVSLHRKAKATVADMVPPLAKLHIDGKECAGVSDIFFVSAVIIKELVDTNLDKQSMLRGFKTMITLLSDSGMYRAAEEMITAALELSLSMDTSSLSLHASGMVTNSEEEEEQDYNLFDPSLRQPKPDPTLLFRGAVMTPAVFESMHHLRSTRRLLQERIESMTNDSVNTGDNLRLTGLDEFVMSPTFYFVYQGLNDAEIISKLHSLYARAYPLLSSVDIPLFESPLPLSVPLHRDGNHCRDDSPFLGGLQQQQLFYYQLPDAMKLKSLPSGSSEDASKTTVPVENDSSGTNRRSMPAGTESTPHESTLPVSSIASAEFPLKRKIRVGFVSSHFRRHSICKLFCGVMLRLDHDVFDVYAFSSLQHGREDSVTQDLISRSNDRNSNFQYVSIGMTFIKNRNEVIDRNIDILVYLDVGMDPSTTAWAAARIAPIQVCVWGHPTTTGLLHMDYFISSAAYHAVPTPLTSTNTSTSKLASSASASTVSSSLAAGINTGAASSYHACAQFEPNYNTSFLATAATLSGEPSAATTTTEWLTAEWAPSCANPQIQFTEQLVQLSSLGFYFVRPTLENDLHSFVPHEVILSLNNSVSTSTLETTVTSDTATPTMATESAWLLPFMSKRPQESFLNALHEIAKQHTRTSATATSASASAASAASVNKAPVTSTGSQDLVELIERKQREGIKIALCPQHMPKFHPAFDRILTGLLLRRADTVLVLLGGDAKKFQWRRTLMVRWRAALKRAVAVAVAIPAISALHTKDSGWKRDSQASGVDLTIDPDVDIDELLRTRVKWVGALNPDQYLLLLAMGDVMLDPFPFGGGVTTLESIAVCTPVVTLPSRQSVLQLAAGMLRAMDLPAPVTRLLIPSSEEQYVDNVLHLLLDDIHSNSSRSSNSTGTSTSTVRTPSAREVRSSLCDSSRLARVFEQKATVRDWERFLLSAANL